MSTDEFSMDWDAKNLAKVKPFMRLAKDKIIEMLKKVKIISDQQLQRVQKGEWMTAALY